MFLVGAIHSIMDHLGMGAVTFKWLDANCGKDLRIYRRIMLETPNFDLNSGRPCIYMPIQEMGDPEWIFEITSSHPSILAWRKFI